MQILKHVFAVLLAAMLVACGGGGGSAGTNLSGGGGTVVTPGDTSCSAVTQLLLSSTGGINADGGVTSSTITVQALNAGSAVVSGANISFTVSDVSPGAILSAGAASTGDGGTATVVLTAAVDNQDTRLATVTAKCGAVTKTVSVQISGASIVVSSPATNVVVGGATASFTATVKTAGGVAIAGVPVTFASTDGSILTVSPASGTTNASGQVVAAVTGVGGGTAIINATAKGNVAGRTFTSGTSVSSLVFTAPATNSVVVVNATQTLTLSAPGATGITIAATKGIFSNNSNSVNVPVAGVANVTIASATAGASVIDAVDNLGRQARLQLNFTPAIANKILLNASQNTLGISTASGVSSVILTAQALFNDGLTDQAVAGQLISFSQSGGPAAGEGLDNALVATNANGIATATFFAGTSPSTANGVIVRSALASNATVFSTKTLTIGGSALSVALGAAVEVASSTDNTYYLLAHSVLVTDSSNNPVANQTVTLKLSPYAFSTGNSCVVSATYCSEDKNANGSLDTGEDGLDAGGRVQLPNNLSSLVCNVPPTTTGTNDGALTPPNSDAGSVPSTVKTDANGLASFQLTYLKANSIWVVAKLVASVASAGTESSKTTIFRLTPSVDDASPTSCFIPDSSYVK